MGRPVDRVPKPINAIAMNVRKIKMNSWPVSVVL
jgi:hypothetical protein